MVGGFGRNGYFGQQLVDTSHRYDQLPTFSWDSNFAINMNKQMSGSNWNGDTIIATPVISL